MSLTETSKDPANLTKQAEGKTKQIFAIKGFHDHVVIRSKNDLTAFNAARKDELEGKSKIANSTTCNVFSYLQAIGLPTHFETLLSDTEFIAKRCTMIPIEWVARRVATGSFLKRNPGVAEGYRFNDVKIETFFKDDANNDPQWTDEQIISAKMKFAGLKIGPAEIKLMKKLTKTIFRVLEKGWALSECSLIDMKVEFGVTSGGQVVLADVIDNDSWRVWPHNDKRLQLDKQTYRDLKEVTTEGLELVIKNYEKVMNLTAKFTKTPSTRVVIFMGSASDVAFCQKIATEAKRLGVDVVLRVSSAHKTTSETLSMVSEYEDGGVPTVVIAVAGRSNGLGPVIAGHSTLPVINCPPPSEQLAEDVWSSLRMPSGIGCSTLLDPKEAALAAAKILATHDHMVFGRVLTTQLQHYMTIYTADHTLNKAH
ncbi:unnamed protein product [Caenorhabditis auriculariae]|uniref:PurE domain-containing protein n=1 Tax=Caenorhabditis auriculariae TaxID=2777116 RepID=A0A8S1HAN6_9PELO|nr:unnamed protein product [Caenorhabditis auriculariae]